MFSLCVWSTELTLIANWMQLIPSNSIRVHLPGGIAKPWNLSLELALVRGLCLIDTLSVHVVHVSYTC